MSRWLIIVIVGAGVLAFVGALLAWLMWPARRAAAEPERTVVDDLRDAEMAAVFDDHPLYEDPPVDPVSLLTVTDRIVYDAVHGTAPSPVVTEPTPSSWMDTVRASMPTAPLDVRRIEPHEEIDPDSVVEGEAYGGNTSWFAPTSELPARPDRVLQPVRRAPLEIEDAFPPLLAMDLEARHNAPKKESDDKDARFKPGEVGIFDHSETNETGAFRWGPDGILVPVADLVAELRANPDRGRPS